jgi:hypothetical protein
VFRDQTGITPALVGPAPPGGFVIPVGPPGTAPYSAGTDYRVFLQQVGALFAPMPIVVVAQAAGTFSVLLAAPVGLGETYAFHLVAV